VNPTTTGTDEPQPRQPDGDAVDPPPELAGTFSIGLPTAPSGFLLPVALFVLFAGLGTIVVVKDNVESSL
jgi:hypothetical protein